MVNITDKWLSVTIDRTKDSTTDCNGDKDLILDTSGRLWDCLTLSYDTVHVDEENENIKQNNQEVLSSMWINIKYWWDTWLDDIIIDFNKVQELKDLWVIGDEISRYETWFLYNLNDINIQKVKELIEYWIVIGARNVESLSKLNIDYIKLNKLKNVGHFEINAFNIEFYNDLQITEDEIMRCKKHGLNEVDDTKIVNFFVTNLHNANRSIMGKFIESKHNYLKKNRTISEQTYKRLFWWIWKYWKTEINQRWLALCYMYNWFELLKKTNWFDAIIQTNLRETQDGWEVRQPFCDKDWKWIKVNKNEIDKIININDDWKIRQANINSESGYYWFKILEIAFMKQKLINDYLNNIEWYQDLQPILSVYSHYKSTWDFLLTWDLVSLISDWRTTSEMIDSIFAQNYQLLNRTLNKGIEYDCAIELFEMWLINMDLDVIITHKYENHQILTAKDWNWTKGVVVLDVKIINESWENIMPKFILTDEWNLKKRGLWWPDIVTTSKWNNVVMFFEDHEYSIEKFYIDGNTWEKRALIINPWHTWVKFDISLEEAKSIFCWNAFWFNIDVMFEE